MRGYLIFVHPLSKANENQFRNEFVQLVNSVPHGPHSLGFDSAVRSMVQRKKNLDRREEFEQPAPFLTLRNRCMIMI
jgi:hypothetical protein